MNLFPKKNVENNVVNELPKDYLLLQQSVQDLIPLKEIRDSMFVLPNHEYKMVVEVKSINYYLKTSQEQETIEAQFRNALSSWDFPFSFYIQTRTIDADDIVRRLKEDVDKIPTGVLHNYGIDYIDSMRQLTKGRNRNLIKKTYIVITCADAEKITSNKTEDDYADYAFEKLHLNTRKVEEALSPIGLACHTLNNIELIELFNVALNKDSILKAEEILSFSSDMVGGKNEWDVNKAEVLINGLITQLNDLLIHDHDLTPAERTQAQEMIKNIESMRDQSQVKDEENLFVL